jgi:structural maintenance of chromosome 3 (chondroitin sulfate proteoglycan 6)
LILNLLPAIEAESDDLANETQDLQKQLETVQQQQSEDSRNMSKQQKTAERYLAKRAMLLSRKDECNRNVRDLGVLPEEAFEKYTKEKLDRVHALIFFRVNRVSNSIPAHEETARC